MPPPLGHIYKVVQDLQGNIVPEVLGTVFLAGTNEPAGLFADIDGTQPLPNPVVNTTEFGSFSVYVDAGHYDMSFVKVGYVFETIEDVQVLPGSGGVHSIQGTANQILVSQPFGLVTLSTPQNLDPDAAIQFARLGLGTPATSDQLAVVGPSTFTGLARFDNVSITGGTATLTALTVQGTVNARQFLVQDHAGDNVAAFYTTVQAAGGTNRWALYASGTAPSLLSGTLRVNGVAGFGGAGVAGYALTTYGASQLTANVTIGMLGTAATQALDVNGVVRARAGLIADTNITTATLTASGQVTVNGHLQGNATINAVSNIRAGGTLVVSGLTGLGLEPVAGWQLAALGSILTYTNFQCNGTGYFGGNLHCHSTLYVTSTLTAAGNLGCGAGFSAATVYATTSISSAGTLFVAGNSTFQSCGMGYAPTGGYWLRAGQTWLDSLALGGGNRGFTIDNYGTLYVGSTTKLVGAVAVGELTPGAEGYSLHVVGPVKMRDQLRIDGIASRPGGGPWTDSNSLARYKVNIRPVHGALAQLLALQGREWEWSPDYPALQQAMPGTRTGLVIEEVEAVRPQWVLDGPQEMPESKALAIHGFEALAIEALREIVARLEALERQGACQPTRSNSATTSN